MKIVIQTQICENYGVHDWDGVGGCPQYWKAKGGETYVVPNLTVDEALVYGQKDIDTLTALICTVNDGFEEYVIEWSIEDDDAVVCEEWVTPFNLYQEDGKWVARRTEVNGEYGYMHHKVASKTAQYDMLIGGERENYKAVYTMTNGDVVSSDTVNEYLNLEQSK
jgi:hypothetical protein